MTKPSPTALGLGIIFPAFAVLAVAARFWARRIQRQKLGADDYMIIPALIFSVVIGVLVISSAFEALGKHGPINPNGKFMPNSHLKTLSKMRWAGTMCLTLAITFPKLSVILLYQRIFIGRRFRMITHIMLVLVSMWGIAFTLSYLLQCIPLSLNYESIIGETRRKCFDTLTFNTVACASTIILDVAILIIPWPFIWRLHMSLQRKTAVTGLFLLGGIVTTAGVGRLIATLQVVKIIEANVSHDVTWFEQTLLYWTIPESSLATIGACLSTLRLIFRDHSLESVIERIRSHILLFSGKISNRSKFIETDRQLSTESVVRLKKTVEKFDYCNEIENETTVVLLMNVISSKHTHGDVITIQHDI